MEWWVWFGLDSDGRLAGGEHAADEVRLLHTVLRERGLEPLLVVGRDRWRQDLASGPPGVPPPVRTAAEIAMLRAEGALELPPMRAAAAARFAASRRPARAAPARHRWSRGARREAPQPSVAVHARPWSPTLVSVALRAPGGEALKGTERLFETDDDGLAAAAEWKGQLEFVYEEWLLDAAVNEGSAPADGTGQGESDAHAAARLLDG